MSKKPNANIGQLLGAPNASEAPASAESFAAALSVIEARNNKLTAKEAANFLKSQKALVDLQIEHFAEEKAIALWDARLRLSSLLFAFAAMGLVGLGFMRMLWRATHDNGLRIEAFSVPAELSERGLNGQVVASHIGNRLGELERVTFASRPSRTLKTDWGRNIAVEVPGTGINFDDLYALLADNFGNVSRISGDVSRTKDGFSVSATIDGRQIIAKGTGDIDELVEKVAVEIFATSQPYRHAIWLLGQGREAESRAALLALTRSNDSQERFWAYYGLGRSTSSDLSLAELKNYTLQALEIDPLSNAYGLLAFLEFLAGHNENVLKHAEQAQLQMAHTTKRGIPIEWTKRLKTYANTLIYMEKCDFENLEKLYSNDLEYAISPIETSFLPVFRSQTDVFLHKPPTNIRPISANLIENGSFVPPQTLYAIMNDNWAQAVSDFEQIKKLELTPSFRAAIPVIIDPILAEAYAHLGQNDAANALLLSIPKDSYDGARARGRINALRKDWPAADLAFAEAVRLGPSLPRAYYDWGIALLEKGNIAQAIEKLREANKRGENWADPLKVWGDALMRQNRRQDAIAKYDAAIALAPHWQELRQTQQIAHAKK